MKVPVLKRIQHIVANPSDLTLNHDQYAKDPFQHAVSNQLI